ncbi:hypothetical protein F5876DRAFT_63294 [Lentinula aff. lateritia]|uniref:Uncharacterized protein n=1 Tax=Lentinula aff. lateritia TaxID=2804960 RepID=A0ACC1U8X0_9AGAR|nr:hypothetical protein F5876DRAFT_63294 [Lentinula aff. lateritia]
MNVKRRNKHVIRMGSSRTKPGPLKQRAKDKDMTPTSRCHCIVCGISIESAIDHAGSETSWMSEFRAIYATSKHSISAFLSGPGERRQFSDVIPTGELAEMTEIELLWFDWGPSWTNNSSRSLWGFPVHCACWDIMVAVHPEQRPNVQHLFDLCRSFPVQGAINFGHNYGGAVSYGARTILSPGEEPWLHPTPTIRSEPQYKCNPFYHLELTRLFQQDSAVFPERSYLPTVDPTVTFSGHKVKFTRGESDPFSKLPIEILLSLSYYLPSPSVASLKLASRVYAAIVLPDRFWFSRFWPDQEFEHVFDIQHAALWGGRWKLLFDSVKDCHRRLNTRDAMLNRKRVWALAKSLQAFLDEVGEGPCAGDPVRSFFEPNAPPDDSICWATASRNLKSPIEIFGSGCRSLFERLLVLSSQIIAIFISTIEVSGHCYISGLRLELDDGESSVLGYIHPRNETLVTWDATTTTRVSIAGFHIAQNNQGVSALAILSTEGYLSNWVGEFQGIPKRRLIIEGGCSDPARFLKGGFDALRLVFLSISVSTDTEPSSILLDPTASLRNTASWLPDIPEPNLFFMGEHYQGDLPLTIITFDGRNGKNLRDFVISIWSQDGDISGIKISYDHLLDGPKTHLLGDELLDAPADEVDRCDISIDYANGEYITGMEIFERNRASLVLKLSTNWDRAEQYIPGKPNSQRTDWRKRSLHPNGTVVGFYTLFLFRVVGCCAQSALFMLLHLALWNR